MYTCVYILYVHTAQPGAPQTHKHSMLMHLHRTPLYLTAQPFRAGFLFCAKLPVRLSISPRPTLFSSTKGLVFERCVAVTSLFTMTGCVKAQPSCHVAAHIQWV